MEIMLKNNPGVFKKVVPETASILLEIVWKSGN